MTAIAHPGEDVSNEWRRRLAAVEPLSSRTYTPSQLVIAKSSGAFHWTPEGRQLADFTSGVLVANLGHHPVGWWRRVQEYLGVPTATSTGNPAEFATAVPLTAYNAVTPLEVLACERLLANMRGHSGGGRMEQVVWAASGSEAIQKALWAALAVRRGSDVILATRAGFHGKKGLANAVTGSERDPERDRRVRFLTFPTAECYSVQRREQPIDLEPYERELNELWAELGPRICCVCTEPYLGGGGSYHPQPAYLQLLDRFCHEHNLVFILDEVQSNFGRTGPMFAYTRYGVEPDIVCLGKGLGNGVPVAAAVGRADLFAPFTYGQTSDTYSAHPLACAAVLATLDEFETTDVLAHAERLSQVLERGLLKLIPIPGVKHIRGEGLVWGVECEAVGAKSDAEMAAAFVHGCYLGDEQGRALHLLGPLAGKVLRISPPLTMSLADAQTYLSAMEQIFRRMGEAAAESQKSK